MENILKQKNKYYKFLIYLIVVVLVNMAGATLFFRWDLTSNKIFSLSVPSRKVVATLSEPLTVKVFFTGKLSAPYNNIERYLADLLQEYSIYGGKYFNYQFFNVSGEENEKAKVNQDLAHNYGIYPVQIQNIEKDEVKFQKAYMGLVLIHGNIIETIPTITSTEGLEFLITSKIQKMNNKISALLNLKEKVKVKLFLSSSLQVVGPYMNLTGLSETAGKIEEMTRKLNEKNFDRLEFVNYDPSREPSQSKEAEKNGILALQWDEFRDRTGKSISKDKGYIGIIVEHGDKTENIKLLDVFRLPLFGTQYQLAKMDEIEESINEAVENVISVNEEIGYLAGHGTRELGMMDMPFSNQGREESLKNFYGMVSEEYTLKQVNLKETGVPEGLPSLIIAGAKEKFSDYELYQIDQYLMKGKNLAVFVDSFNEIVPRQGFNGMGGFQNPVYLPVNTGLEKLLEHYGAGIKKSYVLDENCFKQSIPEAFGGGEQTVYFAPIIKNEFINKKLSFLKNIKGLVMFKSSPVELDEEKIKKYGLKAEKLFSSSEKSWDISDDINLNPMFIQPPKGENKYKQMVMACILEGYFPSYFADKPIPEKEAEEGGDDKKDKKNDKNKAKGIDMSSIQAGEATIKKGKPGKIFVIGTSEILLDNILDKKGMGPNAHFIMNIIDYLNNKEAYAVMRSKAQRFNPLKEIKPDSKVLIKGANIAGLPVLIIIAGLMVFLRRRSRQRVIQQIFGK
ncbi:MAG: Gldg family protein [bacterium]